MSLELADIEARIAGDIVISENPSQALRKWRERLAVRQTDLANEMSVSPSVLSDYESGRRSSPGVSFVKRYVEALVKLDGRRNLLNRAFQTKDTSAILGMGEFPCGVKASTIVDAVEGEVITGATQLDSKIFGYTVLDSIKTIYALSGFDFYKIFGATTERVLVFTKVGLGRSPLVAIRVTHLKPRMVVLHGPSIVDPIGVDLASKENILLILSKLLDESKFVEVLSKL
jgi:putative transcriptional regulator